MALDHQLFVYTARIRNQPSDTGFLRQWALDLIETINMRLAPVEGNPLVWYCEDAGNEGFTAVGILVTSHFAIHTWDDGRFELDIYSCATIPVENVLKAITETFDPEWSEHWFADRNAGIRQIRPKT